MTRLKAGLSGMVAPNGAALLPMGFQSQREASAGGNPNGGKPVDAEENRKELEIDRMKAETKKLRTETARMRLGNVLDMFRLVLTAMAATAAVLVALDQVGLMGGA